MARVFYAQSDANGIELWETDGVPGGQRLVKDINPGNGNSNLSGLTALGGLLLFSATDGSAGQELWLSDGTAPGTSLVRDINPGAFSSTPTSLISVNGISYFAANDGSHGTELWRSNGSLGGTSMVADIDPGVFSSNPAHLTQVNGAVYFLANDGVRGLQIWESDGTAAGTSLLKDFRTVVSSPQLTNLFSAHGALFFNLLETINGISQNRLWKSDGTDAGTVDLGFSAVPQASLGAKLFFADGTVWTDINISSGGGAVHPDVVVVNNPTAIPGLPTVGINEGLGSFTPATDLVYLLATFYPSGPTPGYEGTNPPPPPQYVTLWLTDGAQSASVVSAVAMDHLVTDHDILFFAGTQVGTARETGLFRSDGTLSGTTLVKAASGVTDITDVNGTIYFELKNSGGTYELWKTDGTPGGTVQLATNVDSTVGITSVADGAMDAGRFLDMDNDGKADIVWRSDSGTVAVWQMNGGSSISPHFLPSVGSDWHILGSGDFNGDGKGDILWLNDNGSLIYWQMASSSQLGPTPGLGAAPSNKDLAGIGDVDHDGKSDLIWRDTSSGAVTINTMAGATSTISTVGNDWSIVGVGDFNGDNKADLMFRNQAQGINAAWLMNGTAVSSAVFYPGVPNNWHVVGTGDFNGDSISDVLWHNDNGANAVWLMNLSAGIQTAAFFDGVSADWHVVGTGDVNGDHKDDVIWRSDGGSTAIWQMNGANAPAVSFPAGIPSDWATQAHHYDYV